MPDKVKKPRRSPEKALADRVYKHYKAIKRTYDGLEFVATSSCGGCAWSTFPHLHGYNKVIMPNSDWVLLARTHKLSVREVKDIVSKKRGWTPDQIMEDREQAIKVLEESAERVDKLLKEAGIRDA